MSVRLLINTCKFFRSDSLSEIRVRIPDNESEPNYRRISFQNVRSLSVRYLLEILRDSLVKE